MSKKGTGRKDSGISKESIEGQILATLTKNPEQGFNYKQIARRLNVEDSHGRQIIANILKELTKHGSIQEINHGKYKAKVSKGYITGTVDMTRMGYGFISTDDIEEVANNSARWRSDNADHARIRRQRPLARCVE